MEAFAATGDEAHERDAHRAFAWFLGRNRLGRPMYDSSTGGCRDGLGTVLVNVNEGAESTLAFLQALLALDAPRRRPRPGAGGDADLVSAGAAS